ncbi:hypothetical protein [Halanaerobaculum tunisiense]
MKKYSRRIILLVIIIFIVSTNGLTFAKKELLTQLDLKKNIEIIESKIVDVTGDGIKDKVALVGSKVGKNKSPFRDNLTIIVRDGKSQEYTKATYQNFVGYEPKLLVKEFSGDKVNDVMVTANSGGSGGIYYHLIATFKNAKAKVVFDEDNNRGVKVTGQFIPNFRARLKFVDFKKEVILDISENKDDYINQKVYNQKGVLVQRKLIRPYSYPFNELEPVDYDNDGKYELKGIQRIVGTCNADTIARIESIWSYNNQQWSLETMKLILID